jgi:glutathione S-transferase
VPDRPIRLYGIPLSHPSLAARGMIELKGLRYRYVELLAGGHPPSLWALGFRRPTVPAMKLPDGRRVQGSLAISRSLDELAPDPPLFPSDPQARRAAEDAERWGEAVLQSVPRRIVRWGLKHSPAARRWFVANASPLPAPAVTAVLLTPLASVFVAQAGATDDRIRRDLAELPSLLDEVDSLISRGVIGGEMLGAADFQIGTSVRALSALHDIAGYVAGRPAEAHARRVVPDFPELPAMLPPAWLPPTG